MESSYSLTSTVYQPKPPTPEPKSAKELVIETSFNGVRGTATGLSRKGQGTDAVTFSGFGSFSALKIQADQVISKLNELLKSSLPEGIQSLKQEDYTAEATAERIVNGIAAFYPAFRKQNASLSEDEALEKFKELATSGIDKGYDEAFRILEGLGAFKFNGVREGAQKTRSLITEKLDNFINSIRGKNGDLSSKIAKSTGDEVLKESGIKITPNSEENLQRQRVSENNLNLFA